VSDRPTKPFHRRTADRAFHAGLCEPCEYAKGTEVGFDLDDEEGPRRVAARAWVDGFASAVLRLREPDGGVATSLCDDHTKVLREAIAKGEAV
jgi:hypothetical protein